MYERPRISDYENLFPWLSRYNENILPGEYGYLSLDDVIRKAMSGVAKVGYIYYCYSYVLNK